MGKYRQAAIQAVRLITSINFNPIQAWEIATKNIFGKDTTSQKKGCPKGTFLGLCERELIKGVPIGNYTNSSENKRYAIKAVRILKRNPEFAKSEETLWNEVIGENKKKYNNQMDVVISLWNKNLLKI